MSEFRISRYFKGESEHSIDEKGRMFIPSKMREILGPEVTLCKSTEKCIEVYPKEVWDYKFKELMENKGSEVGNLQRFYGACSEDVTFDKQGRVLISQKMKAHANLSKDVIIVGAINHAEIWDKEEWEDFCVRELNPEVMKKNMDAVYEESKRAHNGSE